MEICLICGTKKECDHHLIFGVGRRKIADTDGITIGLCNKCHNLATKPVDRIHGNSTAEKLSKMLGQALWEREFIANYEVDKQIEARSKFIGRYGRSYL